MFKKILACLDSSELSEQVLPFAEAVALHFDGRVTLLQVVSTTGTASLAGAGLYAPGTLARAAEKEARAYLRRIARSPKGKGLEVRLVVIRGTPAGQMIIEYAQGHKVDLIAMATHGHAGMARVVFGSVADHVVRNSGLPMLLISPQQGEAR